MYKFSTSETEKLAFSRFCVDFLYICQGSGLLYIRKVVPIKLLFICSRYKWRSLTAEKIFNGRNAYQVRSAGTEENARIKVTAGLIGWADIVFVMEKKHLRRLQDRFQAEIRNKRVICLDVPDDYKFMDETLVEILESRVAEYIEI